MSVITDPGIEKRDSEAFDAWMHSNYPMFDLTGDHEEDTQARIVRCVASHAWRSGRNFDPRNLQLTD